ncbi:MAG: hypothetical protein H0W64_05240 [Gammaproteobacteria bacterium]|nr:hypothetical protein [Gammaproteobacteria bacterium]
MPRQADDLKEKFMAVCHIPSYDEFKKLFETGFKNIARWTVGEVYQSISEFDASSPWLSRGRIAFSFMHLVTAGIIGGTVALIGLTVAAMIMLPISKVKDQVEAYQGRHALERVLAKYNFSDPMFASSTKEIFAVITPSNVSTQQSVVNKNVNVSVLRWKQFFNRKQDRHSHTNQQHHSDEYCVNKKGMR